MARVADFECSLGVAGTRFWRAYLIKNGNIEPHLFTQASDVYSYGMTCYEILTGLITFEDRRHSDYDVVLHGGRHVLPGHVRAWMKTLLARCWQSDPLKRPTFQEITEVLMSGGQSIGRL